MRLSQRWMLVVVGSCAAALTACGSSGGSTGNLLGGSSGGTTASAPSGGSGASGGSAAGSTAGGGSSAQAGAGASVAGAALCPQLRAAEAAGATTPTTSGSDPATQKAQFDKAIKVYQALGQGAPPNVQKAANDMVVVLTTLESAESDPAHPDVSKIAEVSPRIGPDTQVITQYITQNCH